VTEQMHDSTGREAPRRTPYELVFEDPTFEAQLFPRIRSEAAAQGIDPSDPERFSFLSLVGDALRTMLPAEAGPEALEQYRALLLHAFNFWRYGKRLYYVEQAAARFLVEGAPAMRSWELEIPHPSVYLQLPANLFWGSVSPETPPEPVDGFFVTTSDGEDGLGKPFRRLEVLVVMGIRKDRAGFSVLHFGQAKDVARVLSEIAALGELNGMDSFRIRAFENASRLLEGTDADLEALARAIG
jgi:hypothetical protein